MRRVLFVAVVLAALGSLPAGATHITEPTAPITALDLVIRDYRGPIATCGGEVFDFDKVRIEGYLGVAAAPSEHFDVKLRVSRLVPDVDRPNVLRRAIEWGVHWRHQNVPPHAATITKWSVLADVTAQYELKAKPGLWEFFLSVTGDVSGVVLSETCVIDVP